MLLEEVEARGQGDDLVLLGCLATGGGQIGRAVEGVFQEKKSSGEKPMCSQIFSHPKGTAGCMSSAVARSATKASASAAS